MYISGDCRLNISDAKHSSILVQRADEIYYPVSSQASPRAILIPTKKMISLNCIQVLVLCMFTLMNYLPVIDTPPTACPLPQDRVETLSPSILY